MYQFYKPLTLSFKQIEKISKALGDLSRLKILHYLSDQGGCGDCSSLQDVIDLAQPSISHHVKILLDAELIDGKKEGRNYRYTLNSAVMRDYIRALNALEGVKQPQKSSL
jgi:ArsR family transcriptional regulator